MTTSPVGHFGGAAASNAVSDASERRRPVASGQGATSAERSTAIDGRDAAAIDALAAKVNELAQTCDRLSIENAELRDQVYLLSAGTAAPAVSRPATEAVLDAPGRGQQRPALDAAVSRRTIGKALGVAAAGVVGAAAFAELTRSSDPASRTADAAREDAATQPEAELLSDRVSGPSVIDVSVATPGAVLVARNTGVGVGGEFAGSAGQIQLTPGKAGTHPASGKQGALYVDSRGRLWFCAKGGTRATWKQLA
jgi:hypothetical protein